eukprot:1420072-Alexandrium_andersonii.AAC.1
MLASPAPVATGCADWRIWRLADWSAILCEFATLDPLDHPLLRRIRNLPEKWRGTHLSGASGTN